MQTFRVQSATDVLAPDTEFCRIAAELGLRPIRGTHPAAGYLIQVRGSPELPSTVRGTIRLDSSSSATVRISPDGSGPDAVQICGKYGAIALWYPTLRCLVTPKLDWWAAPEAREVLHNLITPISAPPPADGDSAEIVEVTVGCDPEFEAWDGQNLIYASSFSGGLQDEIGRDGAGGPVEFRPRPGTPGQVVANLQTLFFRFAQRYPYDLCAAGHELACGGHIHVGVSALGLKAIEPPDIPNYVAALDYVLGPSVRKSGRARGGYARRCAWEGKPWGFEYRTPPAAIFSTPRLAQAVLKIAYRIVRHLAVFGELTLSEDPMGLTAIGVPTDTIKRWQRFLKAKVPGQIPVLENWGVDTPRLVLFFGDEWRQSVKAALSEELKRQFYAGGADVKFRLRLYGLRADRGEVATAPILPEWAVLEEPPIPLWRDAKLQIGLPYTFRTGNPSPESIANTARGILEYATLAHSNLLEGG